ncbi:MAG TPA: DNA mismatch repair endonuclease MutL [Opitutaceae bacterium]|nr:DNA mismatch repair endonuclease MutL [Opitutaceae bacterium]
MPRVRVLTDRVANQIAAGEVIERPAAVIKELVENAIDAGATRVEVEFSHGGRSFMRVEDNGHGMSREDALLALERHATSKIVEADDLNRLITFGFRGEALPSIASVSKFTLQTREAGADLGTEIAVNGGKFVHVRECGRAVGTRIEVAQLFNSVPARRKFLKSHTTEAAHIIHGVRLYALAFPNVAFTLIEDGRVIFRSPSCTTLLERVSSIFGRQLSSALMPIDVAEFGMRAAGLIGLPGQGRATRHEMITFINQRPVDSRTLNYALIESYHESLPKGRYPIAFVFFEISPADVDVNVHPAKREVRFRSEPNVRSFLIRNILARLRELSPMADATSLPEMTTPAGSSDLSRESVSSENARVVTPPPSATGPLVSPRPPAGQPAPVWPSSVVTIAPRVSPPVAGASPEPARSGGSAADVTRQWRFLGLAHKQYALFETPSGLALLDRRAAHERIWFERLQNAYRAGAAPSQRLLLPVPIELDAIASALLLDAQKFLAAHGFEISEFGRNFFRVESVPDWMRPSDAEVCVRDLLALLRDGQLHAREIDLGREELARFAASRGVRLPETVSETELRGTLADLFNCTTPLTSPSGRPTFIELTQGELARRFGKA